MKGNGNDERETYLTEACKADIYVEKSGLDFSL
jgi:hypothetical protein